jgi:hypothetical protein
MPLLAELIEVHQQAAAAHKVASDRSDAVLASLQGREVTLADEDACDHACDAERRALSRVLADAENASADKSDSADFKERLDALELAIEQAFLSSKYTDAFADYCAALKRDQEALTIIRWIAVVFSFLLIILLMVTLAIFVFENGVLFWLISDTARATLVVALVGGAITLLVVLLRGSFRTIAERNKDDMVPEHLKMMLDVAKTVSGRD